MNKVELVRAVAAQCGHKQKEVKEILEAMQDVVYATLKKEEVKVMDGLTLSAVYKEAHEARNPMNGDVVTVDAKYFPKAKFGTAAKRALND